MEAELAQALYSDQTLVHDLIHNLLYGCNFATPRHNFYTANNITAECNAGCILGSFKTPPLPNFCCSGLGLIPKHDGGWFAIYHLFAPYGSSINDSIYPDAYTLSYCSVDDAFAILSEVGKVTLIANKLI